MTTGNFYLFDTSEFVLDSSNLFIIPIKVNGDGSVKLVDIVCSDGETEVEINDKKVEFIISDSENDMGNGVDSVKDSNCDLVDIELSEGAIQFDSSVTEYDLKVTNFNDLVINPKLASEKASFAIEKTENKQIIITVTAEDDTSKKYILYVDEVSVGNADGDSNLKYVFIAIICVLVIINVVRIVKNRKK